MRSILIAAATAALFATPALADDVMAGFYGNTVVSTSQLGESHTHYKADHTFDVTLTGAMGTFSGKGTWEVKDAQLCRTYDQPPPGLPNPFCIPIEAHKVGDSWTVTFAGRTAPVTLKAGIQ
jgi:opacity protein-like surface antigen